MGVIVLKLFRFQLEAAKEIPSKSKAVAVSKQVWYCTLIQFKNLPDSLRAKLQAASLVNLIA